MHTKRIIALIVLVTVYAVPAYSQLPSSDQYTWHGGPLMADYYENFGNTFLEENGTCWQSISRLSLAYPVLDQLIYSGFTYGMQVAAADFTGDGMQDLVIASYNSQGDVILLENPGTTGDWNAVTLATSLMQCRSVASGDIDNDGDQDVVFGCYNSTSGMGWIENPGTPTAWSSHQIGTTTGVSSVSCGDIDQDGDDDVVFCSSLNDTLGWMNNLDGSGTSWSFEIICTSNFPLQAVIADINSDSNPDVAACYRMENKVYWFERNSMDNTWTQHLIADVPMASGLSAGDVNGDSYTDILACSPQLNSVFLCINTDGSGTVWANENLELNTSNAKSCLLLDLEGDGDLDIAVSSQTQDSVLVLSQRTTGPELWYKTSLIADNPLFLTSIDFDGNGVSEIACLCREEMKLISADPTTFSSSGVLASNIGLIPAGTDYVYWGDILWDSSEPTGTNIAFQVRASTDPQNMGDWSDTISTSGTYLGDILPADPWYIQYRVLLSSTSPELTPFLHSVTLEGWWPGGIGEEEASVSGDFHLLAIENNPSIGVISATIMPSENYYRELRVYDVFGRSVASRRLEPSSTSMLETIDGLSPGVYHIQVTSGEQVETLKICIIRP